MTEIAWLVTSQGVGHVYLQKTAKTLCGQATTGRIGVAASTRCPRCAEDLLRAVLHEAETGEDAYEVLVEEARHRDTPQPRFMTT